MSATASRSICHIDVEMEEKYYIKYTQMSFLYIYLKIALKQFLPSQSHITPTPILEL
jgi:hypothetical protein